MKFKKLISATVIITTISGITPAYSYDNVLGTLIGAAGGAAVGSNVGKGKGKIAAIAVGTLVGAGIGNSLQGGNSYAAEPYHSNNRRFHNNHRYYNHGPYYYNTYTPSTSYWVNPAPSTQVIEVKSYQNVQQIQEPEEYCREFNQSVTIGGKVQPGYGTACLQPDGSWKIKK